MTKPLLIAGPCAAEDKEQLMTTARLISELLAANGFQLTAFRAGIWKPRSQPDGFSGAGEKALPWLREIQELFGFEVCVEIAKPEHLEICQKYGIRNFWVGARTTVNPFIVDELAAASKGSDITVMVKNPIVPDLKLWIGSVERFLNSGIRQVIAIHRGVSEPNENILRNAPLWEMPIELKVQFPDIPLICDASHIAGDKQFLKEISQIALDFGFDGLMIETHYQPESALSDAKQQITPEELIVLLKSLHFKVPITSPEEKMLWKQRNLIEHIDRQISRLLSKRMEAIDAIGKIKHQNNLPIVDPRQFKKVMERYTSNGLDDPEYHDFIKQFLDLLHQNSIQRQQKYEPGNE